MMARSKTRSKQRPDTLMQDRVCRIDENLLQRTAGPYIGVKSAVWTISLAFPVYPDKQTVQWPVQTSHSGHLLP
jgi:hypothetical protein